MCMCGIPGKTPPADKTPCDSENRHLGQNPLIVSGCFEEGDLYVNLIFSFSKYNYIMAKHKFSIAVAIF